MNVNDNEKYLFDEINKLRCGNTSDKILAIKCIGILGNESDSTNYAYKLEIVKKLIIDYKSKQK